MGRVHSGTEPPRVLHIPRRHFPADFTDSAYRGGIEAWAIHPMRATARRSAALTLLPLPDQLLTALGRVVSKSISFAQFGVTTMRTMPSW